VASNPVADIMIAYGSAIHTMRPYPSRISGASAEVSRKRNAAYPFGVAYEEQVYPQVHVEGFPIKRRVRRNSSARPAPPRRDLALSGAAASCGARPLSGGEVGGLRGAPWPHPMRFNASLCSRSSRPSSHSLARVLPL
jgi:hypothetical protein